MWVHTHNQCGHFLVPQTLKRQTSTKTPYEWLNFLPSDPLVASPRKLTKPKHPNRHGLQCDGLHTSPSLGVPISWTYNTHTNTPIGSLTDRHFPGFRGDVMGTCILTCNQVTDFEGWAGSKKFQITRQVT